MTHLRLKRATPDQEFPNLCGNFTWMARVLTPAMYQRQFNRCTHSGVIFDDIIRPGLEAPGDDIRNQHECHVTQHEDNKLPALNQIIFQPVRQEVSGERGSYSQQSPLEGSLCFEKQLYANRLSVLSGHTPDWSAPASVGCAAGDAQSYTLFCDFLDRIIEAYHGCKVFGHAPKSDFNSENLKVALPTG